MCRPFRARVDDGSVSQGVALGWFVSRLRRQQSSAVPLVDFLYAPFDRPRWKPAGKGLESVRGAMELYQKWLDAGANPLGWPREQMEKELAVLGQVEEVLDQADSRDRRFRFAARDPG